MKNKLILLAIVSLLVSTAWFLGRLTMRQEIALTTFMDQTVYLGYIKKNDIDSAANLMRISNDTLLLELASKQYQTLSFRQSDLSKKWLKTYSTLRASLPKLPDALVDPEQEKKVAEVFERIERTDQAK